MAVNNIADFDPYRGMADPAKPANAKRDARATAASFDDDPYRSLPDPSDLAKQGVRVAGYNAAGQPILAPAGPPAPKGSAARRFLSSALDVFTGAAKGAYHGLVEGPQNPEEARIEAQPITGPFDLRVERFVAGPMRAEARKTAEEFRQSDPWSLRPSREALWHRQLALGHGLATVLPMVGPAAAQAGEKIGTQYGSGDVAGAMGTLGGNIAMYALPEGTARVAKSEWLTRSRPHSMITKLIRPMKGDLRFGKDPAQAILDEGITGNFEQLGDRTYNKLHEVGRELDAEAQKPANASKIVDTSAALRPLDNAMREAAQAGDRSLFTKLLEVKNELSSNWKPFRDAQGNITLRRTGPRNMRMSPYEALKFKRQIGDRIRWTQDPLDGAANKALGEVYGKVKEATNNAVPGLEKLNERYSNLVGAAKAIERRAPVEARNANWSLSDIVIGTHSIPLAAARHIARLPGVRSRVAAGLYNLPRVVPRTPTALTAPVIAAAQSQQRNQQPQ